MATTTSDVHVNDVGTRYKGKIQDVGVPFDPNSADSKRLFFRTPSGLVVRDATVTTDGTDFYLEYVVVAADVAAGLHKRSGDYQWQGEVRFSDGRQYSTNVESYTVEANLK